MAPATRVSYQRPNGPSAGFPQSVTNSQWNHGPLTCSRSPQQGIQKEDYFTLFADSCWLYRYVYSSETKSAATVHIRQQYAHISNHFGPHVLKRYHLDGGREYGGNALIDWVKEQGLQLHDTTPHNSESSRRAEASNNIVSTVARKLLLHG